MNATNFVITSTEDEFGIRIHVEYSLDNLSLINSERSYFEVLLSNHHYSKPSEQVLHP